MNYFEKIKVICCDNLRYPNELTFMKEYIAIDANGSAFRIVNDLGYENWYFKRDFIYDDF